MSKRVFPEIDFTFSGYVRGAEVKWAYDPKTGDDIYLQGVSSAKLVANLKSGKWLINFEKVYMFAGDTECELSDFQEG